MSRVIAQRRHASLAAVGRAGRFLWEAIWLPYWLGSTMPPPTLPVGREARPSAGGRTPRILQELDALRTAIWRQRRGILVFRSLWLALAALDVYLLLRVVAHRQPAFVPFFLLALLLLALGGVLVAVARPSRAHLARTLDRSFDLRERVTTAYETAQGDRRIGGLPALQVLEATRLAKQVGGAAAFRERRPRREIVLTGIMALLGVLLLILLLIGRGGGGGAGNGPGAGSGRPGAQAGQGSQQGSQGAQGNQGNQGNQGAQGGQGTQAGGQPSAQGKQDLAAVAGALQGTQATQGAASQLNNGDYAGAARSLREAAGQVGQMTPQQRQQLASDLREAAGKVSDPQLAQDLIAAANALQQPGAAGAQAALGQVADDIDRLGQGQGAGGQSNQGGQQPGQAGASSAPASGGAGGAGGGAGGSAPQLPGSQRTQPSTGPATDPLGANGQPVQLPKGSPTGPTINTQNQGGRGTGPADPGAAVASGGQLRQGDVGEAGVDANQVPFEQRGTVQQYFTPPKGDE